MKELRGLYLFYAIMIFCAMLVIAVGISSCCSQSDADLNLPPQIQLQPGDKLHDGVYKNVGREYVIRGHKLWAFSGTYDGFYSGVMHSPECPKCFSRVVEKHTEK